jgi:hypothetical protein
VDESRQDLDAGQFLQVSARFAQPDAPEAHVSDGELAADEVVQRHALGHEVPSRVARR